MSIEFMEGLKSALCEDCTLDKYDCMGENETFCSLDMVRLYQKGREDAIEELKEKICDTMRNKLIHVELPDIYSITTQLELLTLNGAVEIVYDVSEQLKEQKIQE